ncbi:MAG: right-handed parallel beta-helix repeat-containing protein [Promethearchaeota archaeon]
MSKNFWKIIFETIQSQKRTFYFLLFLSAIIISGYFTNTGGFEAIDSNSDGEIIIDFIDISQRRSFVINHDPLQIYGEQDFLEQADFEGWKGNGTKINPFILQGYNITNRSNLIQITNSRLHFQIKNCSLNGKGEGIGISFNNVSNGCILENIIYNNSIGISLQLTSKRNIISKNQIFNFTDVGIRLEEGSELNIVKMNDVYPNSVGSSLAIDNGFYNTFVFNFWNDQANPELDDDGFVDTPYSIEGTSDNNDSYPLIAPNPPLNRLLSESRIVSPNITENLKGTVVIEWTESVDSFGQDVLYDIYYSNDYRIWKTLAANIQDTSYSMNTMLMGDGSNYWIRIRSSSLDAEFFSKYSFHGPFSIQNIFTPLIRDLATILIIVIIGIILVSAILWRKRKTYIEKPTVSHSQLSNLKFGVCYGSFTDKGLSICGKSENCIFDDHQLQSMLEYSALLYQYGKVGDMHGPFPLTSEEGAKNDSEINNTEWQYVSIWIKMIDESIKDLRIIKRTGKVPAGFLLFFPREFEPIIILNKEAIKGIITTVLSKITVVSEITPTILNKIEDKVRELFST